MEVVGEKPHQAIVHAHGNRARSRYIDRDELQENDLDQLVVEVELAQVVPLELEEEEN